MKRLSWVLLLTPAIYCPAQSLCNPNALSQSAARVLSLRKQLEQTHVGEMDETVPPVTAGEMTQLESALARVADAALACAKPSVDPVELQKQLAQALHANAPEPPPNTVISNNDHRYDEILGSYGHNLRVQAIRPPGLAGFLTVQYSINIECGEDNMLLVYELHDEAWKEELRWQSPPLKQISDAFGDFFLSAFLHDSSAPEGKDTKWRVVVAHGTPWCTSRFSGFRIDLLAPGPNPASPQVLWHIEREYSRFNFDPLLKSSGNTFELRLNADCMWFDDANCFERRVIYRYSIDGSDEVHRVEPLALNARGFVEEWLSAPWSESRDFSLAGAAPMLKVVYKQFNPPPNPNSNQFVGHSFGPVLACAAPGTFQVQINSTLETIVPGKPGGDSKPLPGNYFHVQQVKDGYLMLSAPTKPDLTCSGADLMPSSDK